MTKNLLNKTLKFYMTFSVIVMLLGVPLFFFSTQWLYLHETDEALLVQKEEFVLFYAPKIKDKSAAPSPPGGVGKAIKIICASFIPSARLVVKDKRPCAMLR